MHAPSPTELLAAWEEGSGRTPDFQAMVLLATACPDKTREELEMLSVGRRDAILLELRSLVFGPVLKGVVTCPGCSERLELDFNVDDIRTSPEGAAPARDDEDPGSDHASGQGFSLLRYARGDYEITYRLPTIREVAEIGDTTDTAAARSHLLASCILSARRAGEIIGPGAVPGEILADISGRMGDADPEGNVRLDLVCPACKYQWEHLFDIVPFLWTEVDAWARRTLSEVHVLAGRYGWSEASILAMSPWKRQQYIELEGEL